MTMSEGGKNERLTSKLTPGAHSIATLNAHLQSTGLWDTALLPNSPSRLEDKSVPN